MVRGDSLTCFAISFAVFPFIKSCAHCNWRLVKSNDGVDKAGLGIEFNKPNFVISDKEMARES